MVDSEAERSVPRVYGITDFGRRQIEVPAAEEDDDRYFVLDQIADLRKYYDENGYVVVRGLLPQGLCSAPRRRLNPRSNLSKASSTGRRAAIPKSMCSNEGLILKPRSSASRASTVGVSPSFVRPGSSIDARQYAARGLDHPRRARKARSKHVFRRQPSYLAASGHLLPRRRANRRHDGRLGGRRGHRTRRRPILRLPQESCHRHRQKRRNLRHRLSSRTLPGACEASDRKRGLVCRAPAFSKGDVLFWAAKTIHGSLPTMQPTRHAGHLPPTLSLTGAAPAFKPASGRSTPSSSRHESAPPQRYRTLPTAWFCSSRPAFREPSR